ncbi:WG repeat-containing protein [Thermophilibacter sp.]
MQAATDGHARETGGVAVVTFDSFEPAVAVTPETRPATLRRFMTLLVEQGGGDLSGGTGYVCRARNARGEQFALKRLHPSPAGDARAEEGRAAAFREEYATQLAVSRLRGFPEVYGYGAIDGQPAILMEWVAGVTLEDALPRLASERDAAGARVPARTVARIGVAVLNVLAAAAHLDRRFVHRDLSPRNIMLRTRDRDVAEQAESGRFDVCLIDFGSSELLDAGGAGAFTMRTNVWRNGTPEWAPPEMLTRDVFGVEALRTSPSIDVYALCSVLFWLYAERTPYEVAARPSVAPYLVKRDRPPQPPRLRSAADAPLVGAILAGIRPRQADRVGADELRARLADWLDGRAGAPAATPAAAQAGSGRAPVQAPVPARDARAEAPARPRRSVTRRALIVAGATVAGVAACAGAAYGASRLAALLAGDAAGGDAGTDDAAGERDGATAHATGSMRLAARDASTGLWGLVDETGAWAVGPSLPSAPGPLSEGLLAACDAATGRWGYLAPDGSWAVRPSFLGAGAFRGGVAPARDASTGLWGLVDETGAWAADPAFAELGVPCAGLAAARAADGGAADDERPWGLVDASGAWRLGPAYAGIGDPSEDGVVAAAPTPSSWGFVRADGTAALDGTWSAARRFSEGLAAVMRGSTERWGYVSETGSVTVDYALDAAGDFSGGLAPALDHESGLWGLLAPSGAWSVSPRFSRLGNLADGLAPARDAGSGLCGFVDQTGAWVVPASFSEVSFGDLA